MKTLLHALGRTGSSIDRRLRSQTRNQSKPPRTAALAAIAALSVLLAACSQLPRPEGWPGAIVSDNRLIVGTMQGEIRAINLETRATDWKIALNGPKELKRTIYGSPVMVDNIVYVGGYDEQLYAIGQNGNIEWQEPVGDPETDSSIVGSPAVSGDMLVVGSSDHNLYAFDLNDHSQKWSFPTESKVWSTPVIDNGTVYFGSLDHTIYAVDLETGLERWSVPTQGAVYSTALVKDGVVYVGTFEGIFYAIDAATGAERWRFEGATGWYWAAPIAAGNTILAPSLDGNLYALDAANAGRLNWTLSTDDRIVGTPVVVGPHLVVPSDDGRIRVVRLSDGQEVAACNIGEKPRSSLVARGNVVYFGAADSSIRAISIKTDGYPDEEWVYLTNEDDPIPRDRAPAC